MSKFWRWIAPIAPIAAAGGLIASGAIPAADASQAATSITINATSPNYPHLPARDHGKVDGFALVVYKLASSDTATISGTVTTTATNDMATLMAEPFGKTAYTAVQGPVALSPSGGYSFSVTPTVATHYEVQLSGTDTNLAGPVTVYVTENGSTPAKYEKEKCSSRTRCTLSVRDYTLLPAAAYRTESRKHFYLYLAIGDPRLPRNYTLSTASRASRATKVKTRVAGAAEYWVTLTWSVPIRNARTRFVPNACTKDTEKTDGLGLPGSHGCGARHFSRSAIYAG